MRLVDNQRIVLAEIGVGLCLGKQDAVRHQLDIGIWPSTVVEAHFVPHRHAQRAAQLLGDTRRHAARRDAPRLGVADVTRHTTPQRQADLGQLRRLARAGLTADDHHLMRGNSGGDLLAPRADWQLSGKSGNGQQRFAAGAARLGNPHHLAQDVQRLLVRPAGLESTTQGMNTTAQTVLVGAHAGIERGEKGKGRKRSITMMKHGLPTHGIGTPMRFDSLSWTFERTSRRSHFLCGALPLTPTATPPRFALPEGRGGLKPCFLKTSSLPPTQRDARCSGICHYKPRCHWGRCHRCQMALLKHSRDHRI